MGSPDLRRFVQDTLTATTGKSAPDLVAIGAAYDLLCAALRARLHPIFGTVATGALFARAVHITAAEYEWLAEVLPPGAATCSIEGLAGLEGGVQPRLVEAGLAAVLARVIGLLGELVGEDLVMPLVTEAWASPRHSAGPTMVEDL